MSVEGCCSWLPPDLGWVKLNTDGARRHSDDSAACGGVLRDHNGSWLLGFAKKVVVESDCKDAIDLIFSRATTNGSLSLVMHIQALLRRSWCVSIQYISRLLNTVADGLAKMANPESLTILRFQTLPWFSMRC
ncbi:hypothetical protein V6N13_105218 [Hibiscus sabdariffa]